MLEVMEEKDTYISNFARFEREPANPARAWLQRIRKAGIARFSALGFPTVHDEEWRNTNVSAIAKVPFASVAERGEPCVRPALKSLEGVSAKTLKEFTFHTSNNIQLVFVNGRFCKEFSNTNALPAGVKAGSLAAALNTEGNLVETHLGKYAEFENHAFVALNTAFIEDGAFIHIAKGTVVEAPIHLMFVSTELCEASVAYPRNLILAESDSKAAIVESYIGLGAGSNTYLTNTVTELVAGKNAVVEHYKLQRESIDAFHVATLQIHQDRGSNVTSFSIALGGALVRNEVNAVLDGENCECTLNGLYVLNHEQLVDNHTLIDHAKPHCASHELYKGVLDGKSRGVFNGRILVRPDAQKTDAKQTNKTLLLSEDSQINTQPQLKIYADDVKCTHGATIGQLDKDAIFYLRSRGIGENDARGILTFAFANDVVSRIKCAPVKAVLEDIVASVLRLPHTAEKCPRI